MANKNQWMNKKVLIIGGGVIVVLVLVLVGLYGKNITTQTFSPANAPAANAKCATQDEKNAAKKDADLAKLNIKDSTNSLAIANKAVNDLQLLYVILDDAVPFDNLKLQQTYQKLQQAKEKRDYLETLLAKDQYELIKAQKILDLPLCKSSPTPSPTPKLTPTPSPTSKPTNTPKPTPSQTPTTTPTFKPSPTPSQFVFPTPSSRPTVPPPR